MLNTISANYLSQYQKTGNLGLNATNKNNIAATPATFTEKTIVDISEEGLNALEQSKDAAKTDESKLSAKAQSYLENLRKKYGDYDFFVSDDLDASKTVGSSKEYSVVFTSEELEKMAEDEEYAGKVMGNVGKAVDMLKNISEKDLGEGVQFSQLSVSIDDEGNMKLFAQLEKLSEDQAARLEEAKQKRAEEKKQAEENSNQAEKTQPDFTKILFKAADIEADSEEELFAKIFGIDWSKIPDEEAYI